MSGAKIIQGMREALEATELLPCPFCGGPAELWRASKDRERSKRGAFVGCMGRCATLVTREYDSDDEAVAQWNRRTHHPNRSE